MMDRETIGQLSSGQHRYQTLRLLDARKSDAFQANADPRVAFLKYVNDVVVVIYRYGESSCVSERIRRSVAANVKGCFDSDGKHILVWRIRQAQRSIWRISSWYEMASEIRRGCPRALPSGIWTECPAYTQDAMEASQIW